MKPRFTPVVSGFLAADLADALSLCIMLGSMHNNNLPAPAPDDDGAKFRLHCYRKTIDDARDALAAYNAAVEAQS